MKLAGLWSWTISTCTLAAWALYKIAPNVTAHSWSLPAVIMGVYAAGYLRKSFE